MRSEFSVLTVVSTLLVLIALSPDHVRQDANERVTIPDQVHLEAERQFQLFVSWIRQDGETPTNDQSLHTALIAGSQSDDS